MALVESLLHYFTITPLQDEIFVGLMAVYNGVYAQISPRAHVRRLAPPGLSRRDSLPEVFPPDISSLDRTPNARPHTSFYRSPNDPANVLRSTLDNMPVKVPDSSVQYLVLRSYQKYLKPDEFPLRFRRPIPWGWPRK